MRERALEPQRRPKKLHEHHGITGSRIKNVDPTSQSQVVDDTNGCIKERRVLQSELLGTEGETYRRKALSKPLCGVAVRLFLNMTI